MSEWRIGSDCILKSGGIVEGDDAIAETVRLELDAGAALASVLPAPETVPVDPGSDWHLDRYAREVAQAWGEDVRTDYPGGPMPADVRARLEACRGAPRGEGWIG